MTNPLRAYASRRVAALFFFGFASGLPQALTSDTLQAWLKDAGVDLGAIGLFALVGLPYTCKAVWSPFMDRFVPPFLGRRRGWILLTQVLLVGALAAMARCDPQRSLQTLAALALVVAFLSASQDIAADAYRADVLPEEERASGAAVFVSGYRVAMIASGAGALLLVDAAHGLGWSWNATFMLMAGAMALTTVATLLAPEPARAVARPESLADAIVQPLRRMLGTVDGILLLCFVVLFKLPDAVCAAMSLPFMLEIGVSQAEIGAIRQGLGIFVTILGALVGGGVVPRCGLRASLWIFGVLQAVSNLGFLALTAAGPSHALTATVICAESFCTGLVMAGFVAFLMSCCDPRYSATQYALLTSVMALTRVLAGAPSGWAARALGWPGFFEASVAAGIPGMLLLWLIGRRGLLGPSPRHGTPSAPPIA